MYSQSKRKIERSRKNRRIEIGIEDIEKHKSKNTRSWFIRICHVYILYFARKRQIAFSIEICVYANMKTLLFSVTFRPSHPFNTV